MINKRLNEETLTIKEVSAILKLSSQTVRTMLNNKELAYFKIGKNIRIPRKEIDRIMQLSQE